MTTSEKHRAASPLRTLYLARFGFAIVWAVLLVVTGGAAPTAVLLVIYPLVDLAAAVIDRRSSHPTGAPATLLVVNMALSLLAAVGLLVAVGSGTSTVLIVWGLWAITAGAVQLIVGLRRRALGGQWPMIVSGGLSVVAGTSFIAWSGGSGSVSSLAGYAVLGGIFFLVSALRLRASTTP